MPQLEDLSDVRNFLTHNSNETHMNIFLIKQVRMCSIVKNGSIKKQQKMVIGRDAPHKMFLRKFHTRKFHT